MLQVPAHKVKLFVGAGGEKIKWIQRKSKCRVQVCSHISCAFMYGALRTQHHVALAPMPSTWRLVAA